MGAPRDVITFSKTQIDTRHPELKSSFVCAACKANPTAIKWKCRGKDCLTCQAEQHVSLFILQWFVSRFVFYSGHISWNDAEISKMKLSKSWVFVDLDVSVLSKETFKNCIHCSHSWPAPENGHFLSIYIPNVEFGQGIGSQVEGISITRHERQSFYRGLWSCAKLPVYILQ